MDERHDRTRKFLEQHLSEPNKFFSIPITITANIKLLESENGQIMLESIVNMVSRFSERIILEMDKSELCSDLEKLIQDAGCAVGEKTQGIPEIVISVGSTSMKGKFTVTVNSSGWISYVSCNSEIAKPMEWLQNPIGAMGAACFASAEAFKRLLELTGCEKKWASKSKNLKFSFLDNSLSDSNAELKETIDLPKILLVGAGAVGSGFLYAMSKIACKGTIMVLDDDDVTRTNLNRCLTFFVDDINRKKSEIVQRLSNENLVISGEPIKFNDFNKERTEYPIVVSTVDNNEARDEIQHYLPEIIFHGATGNNSAAVGVIKFLETACLCCIFESAKSHEEIIASETGIPFEKVKNTIQNKEKFSQEHFEYMKKNFGNNADKFEQFIGIPFDQVYKKEVCGKMEIKTKEGKKSPSIPFVSFFSGLMLASELIKYSSTDLHKFPMITKPDFLEMSLFSPHSYNPSRRTKNPNCKIECSEDRVKKVYSEKWGVDN